MRPNTHLTVDKTVDLETYDVPAVTYMFATGSGAPVSVRLTDPVPEAVAPESFGFRTEHAADWQLTDEAIRFQREIPADDRLVTVVAVRAGPEDLGPLWSAPTVEWAPADAADAWKPLPDGVVDAPERPGDESGDGPPQEPGDEYGDGAVAEPPREPGAPSLGVSIPDGGESTVDGARVEDGARENGERRGTTSEQHGADAASADGVTETIDEGAAPESTAARLLADLRDGSVSDAERAALRSELGIEDHGASLEARVEYCQSRLSDLEAYADALEAFLDEEGTAQQLLSDLEADLEGMDERLEALEERLRATVDEQATLRGRVDDLEETTADLDELTEDVATAHERLDEVADVRADLRAVRDTVSEFEAWRERVTDAVTLTDQTSDDSV